MGTSIPATRPTGTPRPGFLSAPPCDRRRMTARATYSPAQQRIIDLLRRRPDDEAVGADVVASLHAELEERLAPVAARIPTAPRCGSASPPCTSSTRARAAGRPRPAPGSSGTSLRRGAPSRTRPSSCRPTGGARASRAAWSTRPSPGSPTSAVRSPPSSGRSPRWSWPSCARRPSGSSPSFEECFPPLKSRWRPVVDGASRVALAGGRIVLGGRPDLTLGRAADGGKVVIDLKTGRPSRHHVDDLRFYALVDACKVGLPPDGSPRSTWTPARRPSSRSRSGCSRRPPSGSSAPSSPWSQLRTGERPAAVRANPMCRWCPALASCETGSAWIAAEAAGEHEDRLLVAHPGARRV